MTGVATVFVRHVRPWQRRCWWLPAAGSALAALPYLFAYGEEDVITRAFNPWRPSPAINIVPGEWLTFACLVLISIACAASVLLEYGIRASELRNGNWFELSQTSLTSFDLTLGQILAAAAPATMLLIGCLPILATSSAVQGRTLSETALGSLLLISLPLISSTCGHYLGSYRRAAMALLRERSHAFVDTVFVLRFFAIGTVLGAAALAPLWGPIAQSMTSTARSDEAMFLAGIVLFSGFGWGLSLMSLISLLGRFVCAWKSARLLNKLLLLAAFVPLGLIATKANAVLHEILALSAPGLPSYVVQLTTLMIIPGAGFFLPCYAFGGWIGGGAVREIWGPVISSIAFLWGVYFMIIGMHTFVGAVEDRGWLLRNPWLLSLLQNPHEALEIHRRSTQRRSGAYTFGLKNPVYDLFVRRTRRDRVSMIRLASAFAIVLFGLLILAFPFYERNMPIDHNMTEILMFIMGVSAIAVAVWGMCCGIIIAEMRERRFFGQLVVTPMPGKDIAIGVCLPYFLDILVFAMLISSLGVVPWVFHVAGDLRQVVFFFCGLTLIGLSSVVCSLFAASLDTGRAATCLIATAVMALSVWIFPVSIPVLGWIAVRRLNGPMNQ